MVCAALVVTVVGIVVTVLVLSMSCIVQGERLLIQPPPRRRWAGSLLVATGLLLPVACCCGPSVVFRLDHETPPLGRYPDGVIKVGMTAEEVRALLGAPHEINAGHPERVYWLYWLDAIRWDWFRVYFGPDGKVESTYRD